jgi:hypothetical protein
MQAADQRAGDGDAPAHAAGEFVRTGVLPTGKADELQPFAWARRAGGESAAAASGIPFLASRARNRMSPVARSPTVSPTRSYSGFTGFLFSEKNVQG